ncbi:Auxin-induced protein 22D [Orobanche gracilis]
MERASAIFQNDLHIRATELRLGLPGSDEPDQQSSSSASQVKTKNKRSCLEMDHSIQKAQVVGWPPVRSYRKNVIQQQKKPDPENGSGFFVKVGMDGAPYLRKIDLKFYNNYFDLLKALENMFKCSIGVYSEREGYINGSEYAATYEDKDGDWMLVGDVPWDMFITTCRRLRIMKSSEAKGLGCLY